MGDVDANCKQIAHKLSKVTGYDEDLFLVHYRHDHNAYELILRDDFLPRSPRREKPLDTQRIFSAFSLLTGRYKLARDSE